MSGAVELLSSGQASRPRTDNSNGLTRSVGSWTPSVQNYDQSLYSPSVPLGSLTEATISFDWEFSNYNPSGNEYFSIEYKTGSDADWTVLEEFSNSGEGFNFTNYSYDLTVDFRR